MCTGWLCDTNTCSVGVDAFLHVPDTLLPTLTAGFHCTSEMSNKTHRTTTIRVVGTRFEFSLLFRFRDTAARMTTMPSLLTISPIQQYERRIP